MSIERSLELSSPSLKRSNTTSNGLTYVEDFNSLVIGPGNDQSPVTAKVHRSYTSIVASDHMVWIPVDTAVAPQSNSVVHGSSGEHARRRGEGDFCNWGGVSLQLLSPDSLLVHVPEVDIIVVTG